MATQDYEFPIESKSDKDRIKYQIAASLRFEILSPDLPIVRFQAMFLGDKKATFRNPNSSDSYFRKAFLMGGVLVLDWAPLTQEEAQRIRHYLKPREVIGSLIFEPAEEYHNRRSR